MVNLSDYGAGAYATNLDDLLLESIDETLSELLGRRAKEAVFDYIERNCFVSREEIPGHLPEFKRVLEQTFGKGYRTIVKVIAKKLYFKLGWVFTDVSSYELADYLEVITARLARELAKMSDRQSVQVRP